MRREPYRTAALGAGCIVAALMTLACAHPSRDRAWARGDLATRTGLRTSAAVGGELDPDEAAAVALHSSPAFAADIARLQAAEADVQIAKQIDNPRLSTLAPFGTITASATLVVPLASLLQRPARTRAAVHAQEAAAESLVQTGLDLVRDVRVACADCLLIDRQQAVLDDLVGLATELFALTETRVTAGEVAAAQADAVQANLERAIDASSDAQTQGALCHARLEALVGVSPLPPLVAGELAAPADAPPLESLLQTAKGARPDVRASMLLLEAAGARAGWERRRILSISAQADVQWTAAAVGARVGPVVELPVFNLNRGGIARAEAEVAQAWHRVQGLRQQVVLEVVTARRRFDQARRSQHRYAQTIVPALERTLDAASLRFSAGDESYLPVLDALAQLANARLRDAELQAEVTRAWAELERATGARLRVEGTS